MNDPKKEIQFNEAALDKLSKEQLDQLIAKTMKEKNHEAPVRSLARSVIRSAMRSTIRSATRHG